jgi:predicted mannosyl-3-phosphoglycerate phosphatase (HAD superfamily)
MFVCVDFDGTIVDHCFPDMGEPVPGALKWLKRLNGYGVKIILFTMRSNSEMYKTALTEAVAYLESNGVVLFAVNENPAQSSWTTSPKAYAHLYIDDSAFGCPLVHPRGFKRPCVDWSKVGPQLEHICLSGRWD